MSYLFLSKGPRLSDTARTRIAGIATIAALGMGLAMLPGAAIAQNYPVKPVRIVTPNAPGGSSDVLARLLAARLTEGFGQQVLVDNRPGGNGFIGGDLVSKAAPDGYTLMVITPTHIITPLLLKAPYDPVKDFTPVASVGVTDFLLVVHPSVPANTLQELIALARSKPGALNYSSAGGGSPAHLANALFNMVAGVSMQHVPYKGGGPAMAGLMGGQTQLYFAIPISTIPHVKSGRLKAIAVGASERMASLPQVPTFAEGGLADFDIRIWYGVLAPPALPRPVLERVSGEIAKLQAAADFREKLANEGMDALRLGSEPFTALMRRDSDKYARVIKANNITAD
jgi:tripartite-type tricarboxylate transporter receptor subunit TctC